MSGQWNCGRSMIGDVFNFVFWFGFQKIIVFENFSPTNNLSYPLSKTTVLLEQIAQNYHKNCQVLQTVSVFSVYTTKFTILIHKCEEFLECELSFKMRKNTFQRKNVMSPEPFSAIYSILDKFICWRESATLFIYKIFGRVPAHPIWFWVRSKLNRFQKFHPSFQIFFSSRYCILCAE